MARRAGRRYSMAALPLPAKKSRCLTGHPVGRGGTLTYRRVVLVERFFNKIKHCRRVATRYDKLAANYLTFVRLASIHLWLRVNEPTSYLDARGSGPEIGSKPINFGRLAHKSAALICGAAELNTEGRSRMSSRVELYRSKAEMCRVQAALRGDTPIGRRWFKLWQQWSEMAEKAKEAPQPRPAMHGMAATLAVPPPARSAA